MYSVGDWLKHLESGKRCLVFISPESVDCRIEETGERAYGYVEDNVVWIRSVAKMEDGRYQPIPEMKAQFPLVLPVGKRPQDNGKTAFKYRMGTMLVAEGGAKGKVIARTEYCNTEPHYLLNLRTPDGKLTQAWLSESSLIDRKEI